MPRLPIIDSDGHVFEPAALWTERMPAHLRDRAPRPVYDGPPFLLVDDVEVPPRSLYPTRVKAPVSESEKARFGAAQADHFGPTSQVAALDAEGIDVSVLFPSNGLVVMGVDGVDPLITTSAATAYNDWLAEFCSSAPGRLLGVGMLDPRDVRGAVREAGRAVGDLGMAAVYLRPNPVEGRMWHDEAYEPLWSAVEELDAPVCFHEGGGSLLPQAGTDRFDRHSFWHAATHPMEQQMAMMSILMGGVAERHPALRFAFMECGAGWLPYWMWRMDEHVEAEPQDFASLRLTPTEYVERQCFVSIDTDEAPGVHTLSQLRSPRVVWGSDYPHHDSKYPNALKTLSALPGMDADRLRSVVCEAPLALFGARLREAVAALGP